jgi:CheY-like chemotaxis protein
MKKSVLLVDFDDTRRATRVKLLESRGMRVTLRNDYVESDRLDHEGSFDLLILSLHLHELKEAAAYTDRVQRAKPNLPILLLTDNGVFAPRGTLSRTMETEGPALLLDEVSQMLAASSHIKELESSVAE